MFGEHDDDDGDRRIEAQAIRCRDCGERPVLRRRESGRSLAVGCECVVEDVRVGRALPEAWGEEGSDE